MSYFEKMKNLMYGKDVKGIEEWLHDDFLFVADYELMNRDDWLINTAKEFGQGIIGLYDPKCLLENEHILVFEGQRQYEGNQVLYTT